MWVGKHIGDLPSPFGPKGVATKGLIAKRFEQHALEDLTLQAAAHPPLPSFESIVENTETGTIEDHLAPMVERAWPDRYTGAERFLEESRHDGDKVSSNEAERLKAIITVTGQLDHPRDPMSIIIGRTGIPPAQFEESAVSAELAEFLTRTPWREI